MLKNRSLNLWPIALLLVATPAFAQQAPAPAPSGSVDWFAEFGVPKPQRDPITGELPVKPYAQADANAGAVPFSGDAMARAFGGQPGLHRLVDRSVQLYDADPAIKGIFAATDHVRLRRLLFEQFCHILNAGCHYSGRTMREAHSQLGLRSRELNALVVDLQRAMTESQIPFAAQNRFLAKLAPMKHDVVTR